MVTNNLIDQNYCDVVTWNVTDLMDAISDTPKKKNKIDIPKYQRNLVWSKQKQRDFIDSLKAGFPFGSLLLYKAGASREGNILHALVDGLQRTTTIKRYVEEPTKFFDKENIDEQLIRSILKILTLSSEKREELIKIITNWINGLKGFKESDGYSFYQFAREIYDKLELPLNEKFDSLVQVLIPFKEKLEKESDISNIDIPIILKALE